MSRICITVFAAAALLLCVASGGSAQTTEQAGFVLPSAELKTLDGKKFSTEEMKKSGKPMLIVFWKSCCTPNIKMLDDLSEVYADWQKETGVTLYAVSIDDSRNIPKVAPLASAKEWEFQVLLDPNSDFKRLMNVNATPHVFLLNSASEVIWQKTTYNPGEESEIFRQLKKITPQ